MRTAIIITSVALGLAGPGLSACSGGASGDNTKFAAVCLKNDNAGRCECIQKAVRTSIDDSDFHQVATALQPGDFGEHGIELSDNIVKLVGAKHKFLLNVKLDEGCVTGRYGGMNGPGVPGTNKMYDDMGRHTEGPNKGKHDYEVIPNS